MDGRKPSMTRKNHWGRWVGIIALGVMLIELGLFVQRGYALITFPYDLTSGEGLLVWDALTLRNNLPIYSNPNAAPYIVSIYPPIYPMVVALVSSITGVGLGSARMVAVSASLLACVLIGFCVFSQTHNLLISATSGLLYASSIFVYQWSAFARVDSLAVFWSLLAVCIVLKKVTWQRLLAAATACALAFYTKQTALAAALSIGLYVFLLDRRQSLLFGLVFAFVSGVAFLALEWQTQGQFFLQTVAYNVQEYYPRAFLSFWRALVLLHPFSLLLALLFLALRVRQHQLTYLPIFYFVFALGMTWTVGRAGSTVNHFLEFIAAVCILVGLYWGHLVTNEPSRSFLVPSLLVLQVAWVSVFPSTPLGRLYEPARAFTTLPTLEQRQLCAQLDTYIYDASGPVLSEEAGILIEHGKSVMGSAWMFNVLRGRNVTDSGLAQLKEKVSEKEFSLILLHGESYPVDFKNNVASHYQNLNSIDCYFNWQVFKP